VLYGQRHRREIDAAQAVAARLGVPLQLADASFYGGLASYSALTQPAEHALPQRRPLEEMAEGVPITYVPLRNTFLVTLAAAALESWLLWEIEEQGVDPAAFSAALFVGANALDYSGYPDCRPEFYEALERVLFQGSKLGSAYGVSIRIEAPIVGLRKLEIARLGLEVGAPLELTWSCYEGGERPCGACDSCLLRAEGFRLAGVADPAL
jgi:7-cyano-7-deazaguanine synthase